LILAFGKCHTRSHSNSSALKLGDGGAGAFAEGGKNLARLAFCSLTPKIFHNPELLTQLTPEYLCRMSIIQAKAIYKNYGPVEVLKGVDFSANAGEIVTIVGKSGAGKSTLLHILGTLDTPDRGSLQLLGEEVSRKKSNDLAAFRNAKLGFVFQFHHLLPEFSAIENVMIPGMVSGTPAAKLKARAAELLDYFGLSHRLEHKPTQMSGGEQQRVAFARGLINTPKLIFADEPTGNLDSGSSNEMHNLILEMRREFNLTFVIVTHNSELAALSDRKIEMRDGLVDHSAL
jgi:lipoprotein-releasing system ATP-binding protein